MVRIIPVPPMIIRPSVSMGLDKTNEDELTVKLLEFLLEKKNLSKKISKGLNPFRIEE